MSWSTPDDFEAPPPAYEEDFDRKVALAVETSLSIQESATEEEEGEWEQWDEAKFQANSTSEHSGNGSGGSSSAPQASKDRRDLSGKQKPSWYDEAGLGSTQSSSTNANAGSSSTSNSITPTRAQLPQPPAPPPFQTEQQQRQPSPVSHIHVLPPDDDEHDEQLPPFTAVDGLAQDQVNVLSWNASRSPSPLASPPVPTNALRPAFHPSASDGQINDNRASLSSPPPPPFVATPTRQSLPPPARTAHRVAPRPTTTSFAPPPPPPHSRGGARVHLPHVQFDPLVAYGNNRNTGLPVPPRKPGVASSFYNTSVSASIMGKQGGNIPQPSRNLPQRNLPSEPHPTGYNNAYHSPKPFRPYSNADLTVPPPPPPPMAPQYPQSTWQQPQGGYNYYQ